jgi:hypothetical protein
MKKALVGLLVVGVAAATGGCGGDQAAVPPAVPKTAIAASSPTEIASAVDALTPAVTPTAAATPTLGDSRPARAHWRFSRRPTTLCGGGWPVTYSVYQVRLGTDYGGEYTLDIRTDDDAKSVVR